VVEAKPDYTTPGDGLQQAKDYAEILGLKFAYATNGHGIVEFDYLTGLERELDVFPTPAELWARLTAGETVEEIEYLARDQYESIKQFPDAILTAAFKGEL
jgi:type I restriction enzyme R subunit